MTVLFKVKSGKPFAPMMLQASQKISLLRTLPNLGVEQ